MRKFILHLLIPLIVLIFVSANSKEYRNKTTYKDCNKCWYAGTSYDVDQRVCHDGRLFQCVKHPGDQYEWGSIRASDGSSFQTCNYNETKKKIGVSSNCGECEHHGVFYSLSAQFCIDGKRWQCVKNTDGSYTAGKIIEGKDHASCDIYECFGKVKFVGAFTKDGEEGWKRYYARRKVCLTIDDIVSTGLDHGSKTIFNDRFFNIGPNQKINCKCDQD